MIQHTVLLFGANGQVGQAVRAARRPENWSLHACGRAECDITDHLAVQRLLQTLRPHLVINAAGMTAVDLCEKDQDQAVAANFEAAANLASQCSAIDAPLIHLSTDYVFDGRDGTVPYKPDDKMNPLNIYGNTKLMGEESIRHSFPWHVIVRISSAFSAYGQNLLTKGLAMLDRYDELKFVTDQLSCPTYTPDIADALVTISDAILNGKTDGFGTFHLCGDPPATRLEFMQAIMDAYAPYTTRRPILRPAVSADFADFATRPAYSVLDCQKIHDVYGITQKSWRDGLTTAMAHVMKDKG